MARLDNDLGESRSILETAGTDLPEHPFQKPVEYIVTFILTRSLLMECVFTCLTLIYTARVTLLWISGIS